MDSYETKAHSILDRLKQLNRQDIQTKQQFEHKKGEETETYAKFLYASQTQRKLQIEKLSKQVSELKNNALTFFEDSTNMNKQLIEAIRRAQLNTKQEIQRNRREQQCVQKNIRTIFNTRLEEMMILDKQMSSQKTQQINRYQQIIQIELPQLLRQIRQQKQQRRQIQQNMIDELLQQLLQIKFLIHEEIKMQRQDEEEIANCIKSVNNSLQSEIKKQKQKQKKTETELRGLLSSVLTRMKNEVLNQKSYC